MPYDYKSHGFCIICGLEAMLLPRARKCEPCTIKMIKANQNVKYHERMQDPQYRDKRKTQRNAAQKKRMKDPLYRAKQNARTNAWKQKRMQNSEYKTMERAKDYASQKKRMEDPQYRNKFNAQKTAYKQKRIMENPLIKDELRIQRASYFRDKTMLKNQQALFILKLELGRQSVDEDG